MVQIGSQKYDEPSHAHEALDQAFWLALSQLLVLGDGQRTVAENSTCMKLRSDSELLDAFAESFSILDELFCPHDRPPPPALVDEAPAEDWSIVRWHPTRLAAPRVRIDGLRRVGRLPQLFESFAENFGWLDVDLRICRLFANPPATDFVNLSTAMFADPVLNNTLMPLRLVRFALAPDCCYDPICFDLSDFDGDDCPIVRLEHESILMHDRIGKREVIFDSFRDLVRAVIDLGRDAAHDRDRTYKGLDSASLF